MSDTTDIAVVSPNIKLALADNHVLMEQLRLLAKEQKTIVDTLVTSLDAGQTQTAIDSIAKLQVVGVSHAKLARFNSIALGQIFGVLKEKWAELPVEFTQEFSDCYDYIQQKYGYGYQMVDMYTVVWDAWFSGKYKYEIPDYVNLGSLPVTKLRVSAPLVARGEMDENRWKALADESLTRSELSIALKGISKAAVAAKANTEARYSKKCHLSRETGDLRMYVNGQIESVGFLNLSATSALVQTEIKRILIMANISIKR